MQALGVAAAVPRAKLCFVYAFTDASESQMLRLSKLRKSAVFLFILHMVAIFANNVLQ
jgi:quinol-cytochrome oxidoreductase complex cytochrome b subunit